MAMGSGAVLALALVAAGGFGGAAGSLLVRAHALRKRRRRLHRPAGESHGGSWSVVEYTMGLSRSLSLGTATSVAGHLGRARAQAWLADRAVRAGIADMVSPAGLVEAMVRLGLGGAACGAVLGLAFSNELGLLLGLLGAVVGAMAPPRSIERLVRARADDLERNLSEMLEVVALGLRSGLSFDRSFELYGRHFDTEFAQSCEACRRRWTFGLVTREEALRELAASYDSPLFARVVQGMVRSLRFGSSVAEGLEQAAAEARAEHRARVEEKVAKAPVKMMLPTAGLILPAMLLLVLGPVLLEMMEGF